MKRGDEALNASLLQFLSIVKRFVASLLRFLLSVKHFIAVNFYRKRSFNASSPLLFKRNSSLNASSPLLFKSLCPPLPVSWPKRGGGVRWARNTSIYFSSTSLLGQDILGIIAPTKFPPHWKSFSTSLIPLFFFMRMLPHGKYLYCFFKKSNVMPIFVMRNFRCLEDEKNFNLASTLIWF